MKKPTKYARDQARRIFATAVTSGRMTPIPHFWRELENARAARRDLEHVARTGRVYREPEPNIRSGNWRYRIEGTDVDGHRLQVVFEIVALDWVKLITVFNGRETLQ